MNRRLSIVRLLILSGLCSLSLQGFAEAWEFSMTGIDWKLLEGLRLTAMGSFWKPGKWFNYACVDRNVQNWDVPKSNNRWGTNPDRTIEPVVGTQIILTSEF